MKKILIGTFCLLSLLIVIDVRGVDTAVQKPEITFVKPNYNVN
ncbi:hypothetical protein MHH81_18395 [Psychrobacillus sp. FSL H8-0484]